MEMYFLFYFCRNYFQFSEVYSYYSLMFGRVIKSKVFLLFNLGRDCTTNWLSSIPNVKRRWFHPFQDTVYPVQNCIAFCTAVLVWLGNIETSIQTFEFIISIGWSLQKCHWSGNISVRNGWRRWFYIHQPEKKSVKRWLIGIDSNICENS